MARVLNKTNINGKVMKMIELGEEYIINGQLYDKNSFVPKPLQTVPIYGSDKFEAIFYRKVYVEHAWNHNRSDRTFVIDKNDPNIVWVAISSPYMTSKLVKVEKKSTGIETTEFVSYGGGNTIEIISQDNDRLYILEHTAITPYTILSTINKISFTREFSYTMGQGKYKVLKETNTFIYLAGFVNISGRNVLRVQKYNKFTGVGSVVYEDNELAKATYCFVSDMEIDGTFYSVKNNKPNSGIDELCINKYVLNISNDTVTKSTLPIDWSNSLTQSIPIVEDNLEVTYDVYIVNDNNTRYLNVIRYNSGNAGIVLNPDRCSIYTFELTTPNSLKFLSETKFSPFLINGVLSMYNNKLLLLINGSSVLFYNWNSATKQYENTTSFNYPIRMVGIDMNNNIWIQQQDTSIDVLSNTLPIQISADFDLQDYDYQGEDIDTFVKVEATNFLGEYITADLELTLIGPVEFISNGSRKILVTTSSTGPITIPVKITGPGIIRVNTKYIS